MRFALSAFLLALPLAVWAQAAAPSVLTETEAVRLALARADLSELEQGALHAAEADVMAAGQIPNPTLSYSRDRIGGGADSVEQSWMLSQNFDLAGRRGLLREAAGRRAEAVAADNARRRVELAGEVRRGFFDVLFREATIRATGNWMQQFLGVEDTVAKLARAGEASGYDRRRLARERQGAEARLAEERAELARARARLAALTGATGEAAVVGELIPLPLPPLSSALERLDQHPDLRALARLAEAADLEGRAAKKGAMPDLTVGIGPKWVENGGNRDNGYALTLSIPLPVFDRQQAGQRRALAEASRLRAEHRLAHARAEGEITGLHRQAEALRNTAAEYRGRAVAASPDLLKVAEAAYRGGESGLLELLDAYRGALEAELTALELEQRARLARIEYDLLSNQSLGRPEIDLAPSGGGSKGFIEPGAQSITGSAE